MQNERKRKRIRQEGFMQGILALIFSQMLIKLLGLIYKLYLTNKQGFGDEGNAIYSSGFQIYALLLTLSSIGVPNAVAKLVSERTSIGDNRGAHKIFKIAFITFGFIGFVGTLILFFGAKYIANVVLQIPEAEHSLISLSPSIFFVSVISVIRGYFNGKQTMKATANSQTIEQLFKTIFTIILVEIIGMISGIDTKLMAAGANFATTLATMGSFIYLYKYYKIRRKEIAYEVKTSINYKSNRVIHILKNILLVAIPMSLSSILTSVNKNVDSMTVVRGLKHYLSDQEAKIQYGILSGKVDTLITLPLSFNIAFATALVPALSSSIARNDIETGKKRISFSLLVTMLISLPCTVGMIIFAKPILLLLFPNASTGETIFQIAALSIVFTSLEQTVNGALQGIGKAFVPAFALSFGVATKIILNLILVSIPPEICVIGGAAGAAFATTVCHIIAFFIGFKILRKNIKLNLNFTKFIVKPIIATLMMGICSFGTYNYLSGIIIEKLSIIISLVVAIVIYLLSIMSLKIFDKEEINMIPYGAKIYSFLEKIGLYKVKKIPKN